MSLAVDFRLVISPFAKSHPSIGDYGEGQPQLAAVFLNRGMKGSHGVPAIVLSAREAHISNHADQAAARSQRPETVAPYLIDFGEEIVVALNMAHLAF